MRPSLSVIIPVYNVEKYLQQCLESVLTQLEKEDEIILVNDGSADSSPNICRYYEREYKNICFLDRENAGLGRTRNIGLQRASKDYVIFLDSDDYWAENTVEKIKDAILNGDTDILFFDAEKIYEDGNANSENQYDRSGKVSTETMSGRLFFEMYYPFGYIVQACMAVYKREFLFKHDISFQEGVYYEDNIFSFRAIMSAEKVRYLPYRLYQRRVRENSITTCITDYKRVSDQAEVTTAVWNEIECIWSSLKGRLRFKMITYADELLFVFQMRYKQMTGDKTRLWQIQSHVFTEYLSFIQKYEEERKETKILKLYMYIKKKTAEEKQYLIKEVFGGAEEFEKLINFCQANYQARIKNRLLKLPLFRTKCRVGIYGLGNQTEHLMSFCKKVGIGAESIIFIDSYKESDKETYRGHNVKNIKDVGGSVDAVIISSSLYGAEMKRTAQEFLPSSVKTILLYEECEDEILWELLI